MNGKMSYTGRDIVDIRRALIEKIPQITDKWKDMNESDLGIAFIELIAGSQDMQNFYFDNQAFETYLDTAEQPKNIRSLLRMMNYRIPLKISAKGEVRIQYIDKDKREIRIPKYFQFCSSISDCKYLVMEDIFRTTEDEGYIDIPIMEGEVREKKVSKDQLRSTITPSGNVSRRVYLGSSDVADKSVEILQDGVIWSEVDDALLEYRGGYVYSVHKDSSGEIYILMSINFLDLLPDHGDITIKFVVSKGRKGIVDANIIDTIMDYTLGDIHYKDIDYISNSYRTYGAVDEIDLNLAKILARLKAKTMGRYITLDDYKIGVASIPFIKYSVVKDWKTKDFVEEPYKVKVWAVDLQGNSLGLQDRLSVAKELESKGVSAVAVEVADVEMVDFDIKIQVVLKSNSVSESQRICSDIWEEINSKYCLERIGFGERVSISILYSRIMSMNYVKDCVILSPKKDVVTTEIQLPRLANIIVEAVDKIN